MSGASTEGGVGRAHGVSRRGSARWGRPADPPAPEVDVLIPTVGRVAELAVTLAGLAAQDDPPFTVTISDQSDDFGSARAPAVQAMVRVLAAQGRPVRLEHHLPRRGMAEQRQFLLDTARAPHALFLDDDVWLEPGQLARLHEALRASGAGFVGAAPQGLSYLADARPHERASFEPWRGPVHPETMRRGAEGFDRLSLHNAANLAHLAADLDLDDDDALLYRIAWLGGCVLYDTARLREAGGFDFWRDAPPVHSGEDVAAEWRVMERWGGAGVLPSGAVHLEAPTTIPERPVDLFDVVFAPPAPNQTHAGAAGAAGPERRPS